MRRCIPAFILFAFVLLSMVLLFYGFDSYNDLSREVEIIRCSRVPDERILQHSTERILLHQDGLLDRRVEDQVAIGFAEDLLGPPVDFIPFISADQDA